MSANDYVKYVTEQIFNYFSESNERKSKKTKEKNEREPFLFRWFGLLPVAILVGLKKHKD